MRNPNHGTDGGHGPEGSAVLDRIEAEAVTHERLDRIEDHVAAINGMLAEIRVHVDRLLEVGA
jgi:hypothetical protein